MAIQEERKIFPCRISRITNLISREAGLKKTEGNMP
jgi:hypothetical protein